MKTRFITALAIILVVALPVGFGGWLLELLALFILGSTAYEFMRVQEDFSSWPIFVLPMTVFFIIATRFIPSSYRYAFLCFVVLVYLSLPVFTEKFSLPSSYSCLTYYALFSLIYIAIGFFGEQHMYLWTIVFATYGSDTGAWFVGSMFGKHKMNPRISPKKSWEGFLGGAVFGFILSFTVSILYCGELNYLLNTVLCVICPITAELGDLVFSSVKRHFHVKDFSNLLPGHGGVLDRVDSLMINVLVFGLLYILIL